MKANCIYNIAQATWLIILFNCGMINNEVAAADRYLAVEDSEERATRFIVRM